MTDPASTERPTDPSPDFGEPNRAAHARRADDQRPESERPALSASASPLRCFLVSGFGAGYSPFASGTVGSAVAIALSLIVWIIVHSQGWSLALLNPIWIIGAVLAGILCVGLGKWACEYYADRCRKPGDPGQVVLDEFAGQWIALLWLPMTNWHQALAVLVVQFFLFRFFDILKAPPASTLEHLPYGWGILLDDVAAGICANLVGQFIFRILWT